MMHNGRNGLRRYYNLGEKRLIEWDLIPNVEIDTLIITDATYEIYKEGELYKKGELDKEEQKVSMIFIPEETGDFLIRIYVMVPPESVSAELLVTVRE